VDDVVREVALGEGREVADVGEQDRQLAILARRLRGAVLGDLQVLLVDDQAAQLDVAGDGRLAREADVVVEALGAGQPGLDRVARVEVLRVLEDHYPAGRAAPVAAASRGVRDACLACDLQEREVRVVDLHGLLAVELDGGHGG